MSSRQNSRLLIFIAVAIYGLIAIFHLLSARAGYSHYRDQHVGTALLYAKGSIDLLHPVIPGFNASGTPTPLELPVWQALAAAVFRQFGSWLGWANALSLILFAGGLWPLHRLVREYLGERGAWWTLIFLLTQPLVILLSGQASVDGWSFTCAIWFLFFADRLVRTQRAAWLFPSVALGALSAVEKLPLFMCVGLIAFFLLLLHAPKSPRAWLLLTGAGAASGALFAAWTHHANACLELAEFPMVDLRMFYLSDTWLWYFGDWHYRLNPANWAKAGWIALNVLLGSFALAGLVLWSLFFSRNRLGQFAMAAAFLVTLVFTHLVLVHKHYYILYSPAVAILAAGAVLALEERFQWKAAWQWRCAEAGWCAMLLLGSVQGLIGMETVLAYDPHPRQLARTIAQHTQPSDKLVIYRGGWGGEISMLAERTGLSIKSARIFEDPKTLPRLRELGYTKLVLIAESPLLHALQQTNPGSLSRQRVGYAEILPRGAEAWRTVLETDDLLIKDLPDAAR